MFILIKKEISNFQGKITYQITKKNPPKINKMFHLIKYLKFIKKFNMEMQHSQIDSSPEFKKALSTFSTI